MDYQPRPRVRAKKKARDRLIRLASSHPEWVLGYQDETWWSRLALPAMHAWTAEGHPLRLVEQTVPKADTEPKALSCYGLLRADTGRMLLRFVSGRPVSPVTEDYLAWVCERLGEEGKKALLLVWDNAAWHVSKQVRAWIKAHNREARARGGVRVVPLLAVLVFSVSSGSPYYRMSDAPGRSQLTSHRESPDAYRLPALP